MLVAARRRRASIDARVEGALTPAEASQKPAPGATTVERRFVIHGDGVFRCCARRAARRVRDLGDRRRAKPTIALIDPPKPNLSGSLALHYRIADAYRRRERARRVRAADRAARRRSIGSSSRRSSRFRCRTARAASAKRAPPAISPSTPGRAPRSTMTLSADRRRRPDRRERAGNADAAAARASSIRSPRRWSSSGATSSSIPTAIARETGEGARRAAHRARRLSAPAPSIYLGLRRRQALRLARARDDKALLDVADLLWAMALQIEDGDASQALRDLRAAEQKLREALKRGASDEEIRELTKELRETAERYMQRARAADSPPTSPDDEPLDAQGPRFDARSPGGQRDATARATTPRRCSTSCRTCSRTCESARERRSRAPASARCAGRWASSTSCCATSRRCATTRSATISASATRARPDAAPDSDDDADKAIRVARATGSRRCASGSRSSSGA